MQEFIYIDNNIQYYELYNDDQYYNNYFISYILPSFIMFIYILMAFRIILFWKYFIEYDSDSDISDHSDISYHSDNSDHSDHSDHSDLDNNLDSEYDEIIDDELNDYQSEYNNDLLSSDEKSHDSDNNYDDITSQETYSDEQDNLEDNHEDNQEDNLVDNQVDDIYTKLSEYDFTNSSICVASITYDLLLVSNSKFYYEIIDDIVYFLYDSQYDDVKDKPNNYNDAFKKIISLVKDNNFIMEFIIKLDNGTQIYINNNSITRF